MIDLQSSHIGRAPSPTGVALERVRGWFRLWQAEQIRRAAEEATLREFDRLDESLLKDVGVVRKPRRPKWLDMGRGMAPAAIVPFDYFRLDDRG